MNKGMMYLGITVGGLIGSYLPVILFHAGGLSAASIIGGSIGSLVGIWAVYKLDQNGYL